jgi:uncharacterized protein
MDSTDRADESEAERGTTRARSPLVRALLVAAGWLFVALAAAGAVLPLLPTTPFLLLAAACWVRASDRLYRRLAENRLLGPYLRTWREEHRVPQRAKVTAIALVILSFASSIAFAVDDTWVRALLAVLGLGLVAFLARLPSGARESACGALGPDEATGSRETYGASRSRGGRAETAPSGSSRAEIGD